MRDGKQIRRVREVRPMAFVFDYELLKDSYELNLETVERAENELSEDDLDTPSASSAPETAPEPKQPGFFDNEEKEEDMPF